eukprot:2141516-Rhodomonas_salina.1
MNRSTGTQSRSIGAINGGTSGLVLGEAASDPSYIRALARKTGASAPKTGASAPKQEHQCHKWRQQTRSSARQRRILEASSITMSSTAETLYLRTTCVPTLSTVVCTARTVACTARMRAGVLQECEWYCALYGVRRTFRSSSPVPELQYAPSATALHP